MTQEPASENGFVLVAAIWFVALLALLGLVIESWMTGSIDLAARLQDRLKAHIAIQNAENEVAFRMLSGFFSVRGLELPQGVEGNAARAPDAALGGYQAAVGTPYIALDGRPYRLDSTIVRLQDDRGLYNLGHPDQTILGNLLGRYGVAYPDRGRLIDRLLDYMQKSDLHRLNGASAADYERAGKPVPRGEPLLTPWEPLRVLSWDAYPALWRGPTKLPNLTTTGNLVQINPNTAPEPILASLPGMDERAAERVVRYRQRFIMRNVGDLDLAAGVAVGVDPMSLMFFPSASLELTIEAAGDPLVKRLRLRLSPNGEAPYYIAYSVAVAKTESRPSPDTDQAHAAEIPGPGSGADERK